MDEYNVTLIPVGVQHFAGGDALWTGSLTKLLAFTFTQYKCVLILDSDTTVLQPMEELSFLRRTPVAMPRAYWLEDGQLTCMLVVFEQSSFQFERILNASMQRGVAEFDMEILNKLYAEDCFVLSHRKYVPSHGQAGKGVE